MKLNGWQRLWVLATITWLPGHWLYAVVFGSWWWGYDLGPGSPYYRPWEALVVLWAVPMPVIYVLGAGVAWVRRGWES